MSIRPPLTRENVNKISDGDAEELRHALQTPDAVFKAQPVVRQLLYTSLLAIIADTRGIFTTGVKKESAMALRLLSVILGSSNDAGNELRVILRNTDELRRLKLERHLASAKADVAPAAFEFLRVAVLQLRIHPSEVLSDEGCVERVLHMLHEHLATERNHGNGVEGTSPQRTQNHPLPQMPIDPAASSVAAAEQRDLLTAQRVAAVAAASGGRRLPTKPSTTLSPVNPLAGNNDGPPVLVLAQVPRAVLFFAKHFGLGCVPSLPLSSSFSPVPAAESDRECPDATAPGGKPDYVNAPMGTSGSADDGSGLLNPPPLLVQTYLNAGVIVGWGSCRCGELGSKMKPVEQLPNTTWDFQPRPTSLTITFPSQQKGDNAVPVDFKPITAACGSQFTVWLLENGTLCCNGAGEWGQLGVGDLGSAAPHSISSNSTAPTSSNPGQPTPEYTFDGVPVVPVPTLITRGIKPSDSIRAIRAGFAYAVALSAKGELFLWGNNNHGQCSVGASVSAASLRVMAPLKVALKGCPVVDVACGSFFVVALTSTGSVLAWGLLSMLGIGTEEQATRLIPQDRRGTSVSKDHRAVTSVPCRIPSLDGKGVAGIAAGQWHAVAWTESGECYSWGVGHQGRLGHGGTTQEYVPKLIVGLANVKVINASCGSFHTAVLASSGQVFCFGDNASGQCGSVGSAFHASPSESCLPADCRAIQVACGREHTLVLCEHGDCYVFGGGVGTGLQCGGGPRGRTLLPRRIICNTVCLRIAAGVNHAFGFGIPRQIALLPIGQYCTGVLGVPSVIQNSDGSVISPSLFDLPSGLTCLSAGAGFTIFVDSVGQTYSFGNGDWGQLGLGPIKRLPSVLASNETATSVPCVKEPTAIPALAAYRILHVACGFAFSFAVTDTGRVFFWGNNNHLQSGLGLGYRSVGRIETPTEVPTLSHKGICQIACGSFFAIALTDGGLVYSWGLVDCCGHRSAKEIYADPGPLLELTNSAGAQSSPEQPQVAGITLEALLTTSHTSEKRPVLAVPLKIPQLQGITAIACGQWHAVALSERGTHVYTWGIGNQGRLGNGDATSLFVPTKIRVPTVSPSASPSVRGGDSLLQIACGSFNSCAVTTKGDVLMWGDNECQQCGANPETTIYRPSIAPHSAGSIRSVAIGRQHTALVSHKGELWLSGSLGQQIRATEFVHQPTGQPPGMSSNTSSNPGTSALSSNLHCLDVVCGPHHIVAVVELRRPSSADIRAAALDMTHRCSCDPPKPRIHADPTA